MNIHSTQTRLHCEIASPPVFSSNGERLFALSRDGALVCVHIPLAAAEPIGVHVEPRPEGGVFVAAGWIEGRLATIIASGGELRLSHGEYGVAGEPNAPSRPATLSLDGSTRRFGSKPRLDPYVRWFVEFNPIEGLVGGISLVRDDDDALHWVSAWRDDKGGQDAHSGIVAEGVTALAGAEELCLAAFVGRGQRRIVEESRLGHAESVEVHNGVFVLARWCAGPARWLRPEDASPTAFAAVSSSRQGYKEVVAAGLIDGARWRVFSGDSRDENPRRDDIELSGSETVAGILGTAHGPAIVTQDADQRALYAVSPSGRTLLARAPERMSRVAVHYGTSQIACVVDDVELRIIRAAG